MFLSGRMASDYKEGLAAEARTRPWIWIGSPIRAQTEYVLGMHRDILEEAGASLADVVKSEIFLLDPADITVLDEVWREFFPTDPPARSIFIVDGLGIQDAVIEINHVALHPSSTLERRTITAQDAPAPLFHEPHAVKAGPLLFLSTQLAHDENGLARGARPREGFPNIGSRGRLEAETILGNVDAICRAAGGSLADVAKVQTHLGDLAEFDAVNEVWKRAFPGDPPAWTVVEMRAPRPIAGAALMCDVIAYVDGSE
jgi:enamine deaminase RidA (YjgF/YER057c/UK114 family)